MGPVAPGGSGVIFREGEGVEYGGYVLGGYEGLVIG